MIPTLLCAWVSLVRRRAKLTLCLSAIATAAAVALVALRFGIDADFTNMLDRRLAFRQVYSEHKEAFPHLANTLVIVVEPKSPDPENASALVADVADDIHGLLLETPELFAEVVFLREHPYFKQTGLLFLDENHLLPLLDRIERFAPGMSNLARNPNILGIETSLGLGLLSGKRDFMLGADADADAELGRVVGEIARVAKAFNAGEPGIVDWRAIIDGGAVENDARAIVLTQPKPGARDPATGLDYYETIRAFVETDRRTGGDRGVLVRMTGTPALEREERKTIVSNIRVAGILSVLFVIVVMNRGVRSGRIVASVMVTLLAGLIWTAGFSFLAFDAINPMSVCFAVLFIGLAIDFAIHLTFRIQEAVDRGETPDAAIDLAARSQSVPLCLCMLTTALAFLSFTPTAYNGIAQLGQISAAGMAIALFATFTVAPALLTVMPPKPTKRGREGASGPSAARWTEAIKAAPRNHPGPIAGLALAIGVASAALAPGVTFDFDPVNLRAPETDSVAAYRALAKAVGTTPEQVVILADTKDRVDAIQAGLAALPDVGRTVALPDLVPKDVADKADLIGDSAFFLLDPTVLGGAAEATPPDAAARRAAFHRLADSIAKAAKDESRATIVESARAAHAELTRAIAEDDEALAELDRRLSGRLAKYFDDLRGALRPGQPSLETLPDDLRRRYLSNGLWRIEVYPAEPLAGARETAAYVAKIAQMVEQVAGHKRLTGGPAIVTAAGAAVRDAFATAALLSLAAVLIVMFAALRSLLDTIFVLVPILLASAMTVAATVLLELPFNFSNVIALPLLFGIGVDSGIHIVMRFRQQASGSVGGLMDSSTPRAVSIGGLTTIGSFASLAISNHPGVASMGKLLAISVTLAVLCAVFVLPALLELAHGSRRG